MSAIVTDQDHNPFYPISLTTEVPAMLNHHRVLAVATEMQVPTLSRAATVAEEHKSPAATESRLQIAQAAP